NLASHTHKVAFLRCLPSIHLSMFQWVRREVLYRVYEFSLFQALVSISDGIADTLNLTDTERVNGLACLSGVLDCFLDRLPGVVRALLDCVPGIVRALLDCVPGIVRALLDCVPGVVRTLLDGRAEWRNVSAPPVCLRWQR